MSINEKLGSMGIPGFRSGKKWKIALATLAYICLFFVLLAIIVTAVEEYTSPPRPPRTPDELLIAAIEERGDAAGRAGGGILSAHYYPESKEANVSVELVGMPRSIIKQMFVRNAILIANATFSAGLDVEKLSITSWDKNWGVDGSGDLESNIILKTIVTRETHNKTHNKIDYDKIC
jgi:hypothetical protein